MCGHHYCVTPLPPFDFCNSWMSFPSSLLAENLHPCQEGLTLQLYSGGKVLKALPMDSFIQMSQYPCVCLCPGTESHGYGEQIVPPVPVGIEDYSLPLAASLIFLLLSFLCDLPSHFARPSPRGANQSCDLAGSFCPFVPLYLANFCLGGVHIFSGYL